MSDISEDVESRGSKQPNRLLVLAVLAGVILLTQLPNLLWNFPKNSRKFVNDTLLNGARKNEPRLRIGWNPTPRLWILSRKEHKSLTTGLSMSIRMSVCPH